VLIVKLFVFQPGVYYVALFANVNVHFDNICTMSDRNRKVNMSELTASVIISYEIRKILKLECGQMPNVMAALPNIGGGLCSTPQSLADAHY